ncbi:hypothetical protein [Roseomonas haemaphysalidis]|uniref:SGNH/GDSL hydrolase family protein n=1 Tax=Roseomonas haemaphysalidis TaxID=2768162 RepID=A0ABS3KP29_9PROT|nr:hypothetical protein [Roseomonas haemaphysalidis]MBO1078111.1 hypothetical protein [Roseomonas haemaphysalidis]
MKIAVIGTSNSIGSKGYVRSLEKSGYVTKFDNFSLGHSTSVALPFSLFRFNPDDYDFCVFDFAVNEESMLGGGPDRVFEIESRLDLIVERLHGTKCIPIILIMPCQLGLDRGSLARKLYIDFARRRGVPYFDGYHYLSRLRQVAPFNKDFYFRDPDHLAPWAAYALGIILAVQFKELAARNLQRRSKTLSVNEYRYISFSDLADVPGVRERRSNSLVTADFIKISEPSNIDIAVGDNETLIGVGLDLANSTMPMRLKSGSQGCDADFGVNYFDKDGEKTIFVIRPVVPQVALNKTLTISMTARRDGIANIQLLHGIALQGARRPTETLHLVMEPFDLSSMINEDTLKLTAFTAMGSMVK